MTPAPVLPTAAAACAGLMASLSACAPQVRDTAVVVPPHAPADYLGASVAALDGDLLQVRAAMRKVRAPDEIDAYTACVAAGHARHNDYGFLRHVRTNIDEKGGIWRADAVYTVSPTLPRGQMTIDAQVTVDQCAEDGVPTQ